MRLYLYCKHCRTKIYLNSNASTRNELANKWGSLFTISCSNCSGKYLYNVNEVYAERGSSNAVGGAIVGGIIGAIVAGPIGALTGSTIAGSLGYGGDENENARVNKFNNS